VRFLIDTQLPSDLARWLCEQDHEAEHVLDVRLAQAKDTAIWEYAKAHQATIVTKDEDFAEWVMRGRLGPSVVWLRIGNSSKPALIKWLTPFLPVIIRQLEQGERLIEVR
jgi:predicted nuclease of predicted toxin-antitoxin system